MAYQQHRTRYALAVRRAATSVALTLATAVAGAQVLAPPSDVPISGAPVERVVITGAVAPRALSQVPYAASVVDATELRNAGPMINLSEALVRVPGLVVNNRSNYAQDLQISSRGFGARAGFGVRGVRLYSDGIPASMPDGQGQVAHFDLAGAERIEVLRGPYSVLYGNSSGGVISLVGAGVEAPEAEGAVDVGSFGLRQASASIAQRAAGGASLRASATAMQTDGFRPHAAADRQSANLRAAWRQPNDSITLAASFIDQTADDPLGLTREQFDADPLQTTQQALDFDTRKTARQTQAGGSWRHAFGNDGALRDMQVAAYAGTRAVMQWLAIPVETQAASPRHGGGVVDLGRDYGGVDARLHAVWPQLELTAGVAAEAMRDARRGYENFVGPPGDETLGVTGSLRRDETNRATSQDLYAQLEWTPVTNWTANAGLRAGRTKLSTNDAYLSNGDDSGSMDYDYVNPVVGIRWQAARNWQLYASAARGFESPTLGELAYRADGSGGFNTALQPQVSKQVEAGIKWRSWGPRPVWEAEFTLFHIRVDDEIGVATNAGGRQSFQNVGRTRRQGAELSATWRPAQAWRAQMAATALSARYEDDFLTCSGVPCLAPDTLVPAGNRIAGTQPASGWAELAYQHATWGEWGLEWRAAAATQVNDLNSDQAGGYGLLAARWSHVIALGDNGSRAEVTLRVDNLTDRRYAGSVIVNESNGRYFETGVPRSVWLGIRLVGAL